MDNRGWDTNCQLKKGLLLWCKTALLSIKKVDFLRCNHISHFWKYLKVRLDIFPLIHILLRLVAVCIASTQTVITLSLYILVTSNTTGLKSSQVNWWIKVTLISDWQWSNSNNKANLASWDSNHNTLSPYFRRKLNKLNNI